MAGENISGFKVFAALLGFVCQTVGAITIGCWIGKNAAAFGVDFSVGQHVSTGSYEGLGYSTDTFPLSAPSSPRQTIGEFLEGLPGVFTVCQTEGNEKELRAYAQENGYVLGPHDVSSETGRRVCFYAFVKGSAPLPEARGL